jgi:hypothetical protein
MKENAQYYKGTDTDAAKTDADSANQGGLLQTLKEGALNTIEFVAEKTQQTAEYLKGDAVTEDVKDATSKAVETTKQAGDATKEAAQNASDKAKDAADKTKETAQNVKEDAKESAQNAKEAVKNAAEQTKPAESK